MNREILFRGKNKCEWVYGGFHKHLNTTPCVFSTEEERVRFFDENEKYVIINDILTDWNMPTKIDFKEIRKETLGQYTGLKDKNGKKIFEGDIVRAKDSFFYNDGYYKIVYTKGGFMAEDKNESEEVTFGKDVSLDDFEVVGNIHDNPELLKGDIK